MPVSVESTAKEIWEEIEKLTADHKNRVNKLRAFARVLETQEEKSDADKS